MAGGYLLDDPGEEAALFARLESSRRILASGWGNAAVAANVSATAALYPWLRPGVVLGLAKGGYSPGSAVTQTAAQAGVAAQEKHHGGWLHALGGFVKGASRVGFAALGAPLEMAQGQFRNIVSGDPQRIAAGGLATFGLGDIAGREYNPINQTTIATLAKQSGRLNDTGGFFEGVNTGSGFFVGGKVAADQAAAARVGGSIAGHATTPGRFVANLLVEPGSKPYTILSGLTDAAIALADPTPGELGAGKRFAEQAPKVPLVVRAGTKVLERTKARRLSPADAVANVGLVNGTRRTVLPEVADSWFASRQGRKVVDYLASEGDFQHMWVATGRKVPVRLLDDLTRATTPEQVRDVLRPAIGITLRDKPTVGGLAVGMQQRLSGVRAFQQMPGHRIDLTNPDEAVRQLDLFQRNARLPEDVIARNNAALARSRTGIEAYRVVVHDVLGGVEGALKQGGADPRVARRISRAWGNQHAELTRYFVDEIGENVRVPGSFIDGTGKALPTPHLFAEYLHTSIPLPNARDIKRATSRFSGVLSNPAVRLGVAAGDWIMQDVWKPMVLLRGAWTVRVVGEEQVRMGASGLNSLVAHPLSALAWATGRRGATDITGNVFDDAAEFGQALSRRSAGWRDDAIRTRHKVLVRQDEEDYAHAWADELAQLHSDPVARRLAAGGLGPGDVTPGDRAGVAGIKNWFFDGAGRTFRKEMAANSGRDVLLSRAGSDAYVDSVLRRVRVKTADHGELLDAVASGRVGGHALSDGGRPARKALKQLTDLTDEGIGPKVVKGDLVVRASRGGHDFGARYDHAVEAMFNGLMTRPTNYLSRSSTFKQFYWQRAEELLPFMDSAAQDATVVAARTAGLDAVARRMERVRARGVAGTLDLANADVVAKGHGLDQTRRLLYDLSEKSQWADTLRLVFPFGEAWKEILTRWARIGADNPKVLRVAHQGIEGARGQGIFHTDEQGQEVFSYPGSGWLTQKALGVRAPLEGRVAGLNLFSSSVIPGVGPVVSIPAGHLLPDRPEWDGIRSVLLPFGEQDTSGGFGESFLPPWAQKMRIALGKGSPAQDRQFANTVFDLARAMAASGKYPTATPEDVDRLITDARHKAKALYLIRGGAQFFAPSAPRPTVYTKDPEGHLVVADLLVKDYRAMQNTLGYDGAVGAFLDKYGQGALLFMQPKTRSLADVPATKEALDFVRSHPSVTHKFPLTYGLFLGSDGEFDFAAYQRQIERGSREALTPEQAVALANARVANWIYRQAKEKVGSRPGQAARDWLFNVKTALQREYPGYGDYTGLTERATSEQRVEELTRAVGDKALRDTDAGKAIGLYLTARAKAQDTAQAQGLRSFTSAVAAAPIRRWLRAVGEALVAEQPAFAPAWEQLFSNEIDVAGEAA